MAKPVVLVVDDEADSLRALTQELESRYGAHYRIVARASATDALATLAELRAEDAAVPLVLADQWMPETTGIELLARARELHPTARRGLLISWGDRSATAPILAAAALGQIEFYLPKPSWSPDEEFHLALTASLGEWWRQQGGRFEAVTVIGGEHHARSHEIRDLLTRNSVPFGFHRGDSAEGRAALRRLGLRPDQGPVVALYSGTVLVDPTNAEVGAGARRGRAAAGADLRRADRGRRAGWPGRRGLRGLGGPAHRGAGAGGLRRPGRDQLTDPQLPGLPVGRQRRRAGLAGVPAGLDVRNAVRLRQPGHRPWRTRAGSTSSGLEDGSEVRGRAVIIATGASYRRLAVPGLEALVGAGVFYGAATVQAQAMAGRHAVVVGGGNSAGQAALHLSKYASQVSVLVRSRSLAASMSDYLIREIDAAPNVEVRYGVEVVGGGGDGRLDHLRLRDRFSGGVDSLPAAGLFVLIGAEPFTGWLPDRLGRDRWGYVLTGADAGEPWPLERAPLPLETTMPGVFAVGDVRHGSVKRVASAVGEGSMCIHQVHQYLALP